MEKSFKEFSKECERLCRGSSANPEFLHVSPHVVAEKSWDGSVGIHVRCGGVKMEGGLSDAIFQKITPKQFKKLLKRFKSVTFYGYRNAALEYFPQKVTCIKKGVQVPWRKEWGLPESWSYCLLVGWISTP